MSKSLKTVLDTLLQPSDKWQLQLLAQWPEIVGSLATQVQLLKIYPDTLVLGVNDSCWMQELYLLSHMLVQKINQKLDAPRIKNLRFKLIGTDTEKPKKPGIHKLTTQKKALCLLPAHEHALGHIKDPCLAGALSAYLMRCQSSD